MDTSIQKEKDALSCSVCSEMLKEPKILPCQHRLCEGCLTSHIAVSTTKAADGQLGFSCPDCRKFIQAPSTSGSPSTWAAEFMTDLRLKRLTEVYTYRRNLPKSNEQHVSHPCVEHANTEVDLYCVDCSQAICHLCATTCHRKCNLVTITNAAEYLRSKQDKSLIQAQSIIVESAKRMKVRESLEKEVDKKVVLVETEIRQLTQKVLEYQQYQLLQELNQYYDALLKNLLENISTLAKDVAQLMADLRPSLYYTDIDLCLDTSFNATIDSFNAKYIASSKQYDNLCKKLSATCRFEASCSPYASLGSILFVSEICNTKGPDDTVLPSSMPTHGSMPVQSGTIHTQESLSTPIDLTVTMPTLESMSLPSGSQTPKSMQGPISISQTNHAKRGETSKFDRVPETLTDGTFLPLKKRK